MVLPAEIRKQLGLKEGNSTGYLHIYSFQAFIGD
ncbi:AbrB/MazE/SpoVT family DNA-binding domain-containing protein [Moorella sulfitireducens]